MYTYLDWGYVEGPRCRPVVASTLEGQWCTWFQTNQIVPICITLQEPRDQSRLERTLKHFDTVGLSRFLYLFHARRPSAVEAKESHPLKKGEVGCWYSHLSVMDWAARKFPCSKVLIFEDDARFVYLNLPNVYKQFFRNSTQTLCNDTQLCLDIYFLGHSPQVAIPVNLMYLCWRVRSVLAHAYVIVPNAMNCLLSKFYRFSSIKCLPGPIDQYYSKEMSCFATWPMICPNQENEASDVQSCVPCINIAPQIMEFLMFVLLPILFIVLVGCLVWWLFHI